MLTNLFNQKIYRDKWLVLAGLPIVAIIQQHIGLSWETTKDWLIDPAYFPTLFYNLLGIALIFLMNKGLILWLDSNFPYRNHFGKRLLLQLLAGLVLTISIGELHSYAYIVFMNNGIAWDTQYSTDLPFAILLTILIHLIYTGFYLRNHPQQTSSDQYPDLSVDEEKQLEVGIGNKKMLIRPVEISLLFSQNKITRVLTKDGKRYIFSQSLKQAREELNPLVFFQANRKVILNKSIIKGYHRLPSRKLEIILEPDNLFEEPIYVSKEKSSVFLNWLSASG